MDKVKINSIKEFLSPEALGKRVVDVEIQKDNDWYMVDPITSVRDLRRTRLLEAKEENDPLSYVLDYQVDSSRGFKRYLVRTAVDRKYLYIFTIQCNQDAYDNVQATALSMLNSFRLSRQDTSQ